LALSFATWAFAQNGILEPGDFNLASGEYYDLYTYVVAAPITLSIELDSNDFDVYLIVLDPSNAVVAEFDDTTGFGTNLRERVTLESAGVHTLVVTSAFPGETGRYSLRIDESPMLSKGNKAPVGVASPTSPPSNPQEVAAVRSTSAPRPGFVVGRIMMPDGNPITIAGATITVWISGVSYQSGQNVSFSVNPNPDGTYAQRVPDGSYRVTARMELPFDGERFRVGLQPNGPRVGDRDSEPGIAQDFTWFIQGQRPETGVGTTNPYDFFGAYASMRFNFYREDIRRSVEAGPPGTRLLFTLTPLGPRIDGNPAETLTYELSYEGISNDFLDVPIAPYVVTGVEITPDGRSTPLLMKVGFDQYAASLELRFKPSFYSGEGAQAALLGFSRTVP
jgi:hypothetical protein